MYCKTSDRSRAKDRCLVPNTGRQSHSLVLIEAGPQLQGGSRIQAEVGYRYGSYIWVSFTSETASDYIISAVSVECRRYTLVDDF